MEKYIVIENCELFIRRNKKKHREKNTRMQEIKRKLNQLKLKIDEHTNLFLFNKLF